MSFLPIWVFRVFLFFSFSVGFFLVLVFVVSGFVIFFQFGNLGFLFFDFGLVLFLFCFCFCFWFGLVCN